jgi:hypothetical protein
MCSTIAPVLAPIDSPHWIRRLGVFDCAFAQSKLRDTLSGAGGAAGTAAAGVPGGALSWFEHPQKAKACAVLNDCLNSRGHLSSLAPVRLKGGVKASAIR